MDLVDRIIAREGGAKITNDPNDPGGLTKYGISQRSHPNLDIANLTYEQAKDIYIQEYFMKPNLQLLPTMLQEPVMDCCVHSGPQTAIKLLQKILAVAQDGIIGPNTLKVLSGQNLQTVYTSYQRERILFLARQVVNDPTKLKYLLGWLSRVLNIVQ